MAESTSAKLSARQTLTIGVALFTMFFGAGNLIFPPMLAFQAGDMTALAFIGFVVSAIGLPVLGVMAVAKSGALHALAANVGPRFSKAFTLLVVLAIGPLLAIPRTASTSYAMVLQPFAAGDAAAWVQLGYTVAFFGLAFALALRPNHITGFLGKVSGPVLLVLVGALVVGALATPAPAALVAQPQEAYAQLPVIAGFLEGYQTMDALAALLFGAVIALNVRDMGVRDSAHVAKATSKAGLIMGVVMALVYSGLAYVGLWASGLVAPGADVTGATVLSAAAGQLFGDAGVVVVGVIFVLACLNVCTSLLCTVAEHFTMEFPRFSYRTWLIAFTLASLALANFGLAAIIQFSVPLLKALYPVAIVLIVLGLMPRAIKRYDQLWKWTVAFTAVASVALVLIGLIWPDAGTHLTLLSYWPLFDQGLGWLAPAVAGAAAGMFASRRLATY